MKITNPTVFLRDGELFCLTAEVPKEPKPNHSGSLMDDHYLISEDAQKFRDYETAIASTKSSAVRVKNTNDVYHLLKVCKDDALNTLTGYEAIIFGLHPNESYAMIATISPAVKEESQEELWKEVAHIVDFTPSNFENVMLENLQSRFTITRKK